MQPLNPYRVLFFAAFLTAALIGALPNLKMIGCFGVAPSGGQAISTATSAEHGGNMDYRGFVSGVTVYFPVLTPGALLFVVPDQ
jgi:acetamidase/formamidase